MPPGAAGGSQRPLGSEGSRGQRQTCSRTRQHRQQGQRDRCGRPGDTGSAPAGLVQAPAVSHDRNHQQAYRPTATTRIAVRLLPDGGPHGSFHPTASFCPWSHSAPKTPRLAAAAISSRWSRHRRVSKRSAHVVGNATNAEPAPLPGFGSLALSGGGRSGWRTGGCSFQPSSDGPF